jgi:pyruvate formate lyase activating enzyme
LSDTALVSNIQKYTIHDGPGIRTEVFFSGCTMRCIWCSNPETIEQRERLGFYPAKCITREKCGLCVKACPVPEKTLVFDDDGVLQRVKQVAECDGCFKCAEVCPPRAIKVWGERYTVAELMKIIEEDRSFYERTGGGVTLSGGEVLAQADFAAELLTACKQAGINTCVETALNVPWSAAERVFRLSDMIITDVKHIDSEKHREITGAGNELILENIRKTAEFCAASGVPLVIRTPIVPDYNADDANIRATGEFLRGLPVELAAYQLLPYRKMGTEKYDSLGDDYPMGDYAPPERADWEARLLELAELLRRDYGLPAVAGSAGKL